MTKTSEIPLLHFEGQQDTEQEGKRWASPWRKDGYLESLLCYLFS